MVRLTKRQRRYYLLYPALFGLGAGALASCATEINPAPQAAAVRPSPPPPEISTGLRNVPRPARKPTPPPPAGSSAPDAGERALAMTEPQPSVSSALTEPATPPTAAAGSAVSAGPAGSLPSHVELIGLDQPTATRLFGATAEQSEEPPATVWRYKNATCELDLFFYLDLRSGRMRTLHYALKDDSGGAAQTQNCVRSLIASRAS